MRGILEGELIEVRKNLAAEGLNTDAIDALITLKVRELQEPWMPIDEFLKSGFEGMCWIAVRSGSVYPAMKIGSKFIDDLSLGTHIYPINITHVMQIHKPEPPR